MRSTLGLPTRWAAILCLLAALSCLLQPSASVKEHDFKKCDQSGFANAIVPTPTTSTLTAQPGALPTKSYPNLPSLKMANGKPAVVARISIDEEKRQKKEIELRHNSKARKERYNEAEDWVIVGGLELDKQAQVAFQDKSQVKIKYGGDGKLEVVIKFSPFEVDFRRDDESHIKFNDRGLFNMEHWRPKIEKEKAEGDDSKAEENAMTDGGEDESTWWDESFGGNTDSKPRGPESVAMDISFVGYEQVFGIPEHTGSISLKQTRGGDGNHHEPYRLYNTDVFEYILDSPMTLYGAIPFMQAHRKDSSVGVFWLNAAETWVDIVKAKDNKNPPQLGQGCQD
ncbi:glucosidase II [Metarhizium acridum]|nr:glucosidase II [Metarhizium acridum]